MPPSIQGVVSRALKVNPGKPFCCDCLSEKARMTSPEDRQAFELIFQTWQTLNMTKSEASSGCGKQKETIQYL
jgi:hypothetical protein